MGMPKKVRNKNRGEALAEAIETLEELTKRASEKGSYAAATQAAAKAAALSVDLARLQEVEEIERTEDDLTKLGLQIRLAARDGSWVAVSKLREIEKRLLCEQPSEEDLSEEELVDLMVGDLNDLPPELRQLILARFTQ